MDPGDVTELRAVRFEKESGFPPRFCAATSGHEKAPESRWRCSTPCLAPNGMMDPALAYQKGKSKGRRLGQLMGTCTRVYCGIWNLHVEPVSTGVSWKWMEMGVKSPPTQTADYLLHQCCSY